MAIEIFRAGTHTAHDGRSLTFTVADVLDIAHSYDPALHRAPLVLGHPEMDDPSYGSVGNLEVAGDVLVADIDAITMEFRDWVNAGHYDKVSVAIYPPQHPGNPKPGHYYLKHVGFLGATAPAVKGLKTPKFSEGQAEEGVILFASAPAPAPAPADGEAAEAPAAEDKAEPEDEAQEVEPAAAPAEEAAPEAVPADPEAPAPTHPDPAQAAFAEGDLTARLQEVLRREAALLERERRAVQAEAETFAEGLEAKGVLLPCDRQGFVEFAASLSDEPLLFAEGNDEGQAKSPARWFREWAGRLAPTVIFGEVAATTHAPPPDDSPRAWADQIVAYQEDQKQKGRVISVSQAATELRQGDRK